MGNANIPQVFNQRMERLAMLDKATRIGYKQVHNGIWKARFTLPADDPKNEYCKKFNYVEIFDDKRRIELFRIKKSTFSRGGQKGFVNYELEHVITTLINNVLFKFHQIGNRGVFTPQVINYILSFQTVRNWVLGRCEFNHQFLYKWESSNLLFALFDVPKPFIDEWHFTYDTTVYPWVINLVRAETEIGCELRRRKNMQGITKDEDATSIVTRLYPLGYGEGDNQLTIRDVNNGVEFLDADTIDLWGVVESIWTDRRFEDAENMKATAQKMLERLKMPFVSYSVDSIDLFKRTKQDFDEFREGKVVRVIDRQDGIDLDTRIMEIDKPDVTTADINVIIANKDRNVAGSIAALQERSRINDTFAQGAETVQTIPFADNAEPNFPTTVDIFIDAGMVNVNKAIMRVQLEPYRAFSRAIRGGGGRTTTSTSGGGVSTSTSNGGATTQTTTQQAQQTPTTSTSNTQAPTTSTTNSQSPTSGASSQNTTQGGGVVTSGASSQSTTQGGGVVTSGASSQSTTESGGNTTSGMQNSQLTLNIHQATVQWTAAAGSASHVHGFVLNVGHTHNVPGHTHGMAHTHNGGNHQHGMAHTHNGGNHTHGMAHTHTVTIPGHSHTVTIPGHSHTVTIPAHGHSVTIPNHTHSVTIPDHSHNITMPDHTHEIEFGIFQGQRADSISINVDGNAVPVTTNLNNINLIPFLRRDTSGRIVRGAWHTIRIIPNRQSRIVGAVYLNVFTNSRGGENL